MNKNCEKCGSDKIIPQVKIIDRGDYNIPTDLTVLVEQNPNALIFKERVNSGVFAKVCGNCGFLELYANEPKKLYEAHENKHPF